MVCHEMTGEGVAILAQVPRTLLISSDERQTEIERRLHRRIMLDDMFLTEVAFHAEVLHVACMMQNDARHARVLSCLQTGAKKYSGSATY